MDDTAKSGISNVQKSDVLNPEDGDAPVNETYEFVRELSNEYVTP